MGDSYYAQLAWLVMVNTIVAFGAALPLSAGLLVVCFGTFMGVGAIAAAYLSGELQWPVPVALAGSILVAGLLGWLIAVITQRTRGFIFAILSLAIAEASRVAVTNLDVLGGPLGYRASVAAPGLLVPLTSLCGVLLVVLFLDWFGVRQALFSLRRSEKWSALLGIESRRHRSFALAAGAAIAGLGGGLYILSIGIFEPKDLGAARSIIILLFPIVGGVARLWGPAFGAVLLTLLPELLRFSSGWRMIFYGSILVLVSVALPEGLSAAGVFRRRKPIGGRRAP